MFQTPTIQRALQIFALGLVLPVAGFCQNYTLQILTSNGPIPAAHTDPNLINTWGLSRSSSSPWWVSDNGTGKSTLYDGTGTPQSLVVNIPTASGSGTGVPTGTIYNGSQDFQLSTNNPAIFLFATEDGTVSGWNPNVDSANAIIKIKTPGAIYKGITAGMLNGKQVLYVSNFATGKVEMYDATFNPVQMPGDSFRVQDAAQGSGKMSPYNVQNIGGTIFVTFARQNAAGDDSASGPGLGFVAAFTPAGRLVKTFEHGSFLNAPWGLALAPSDFGSFSHTLLVGQFGSGQIVAFNIVTGAMVGILADENNTPLVIDGLWGISFGNGTLSGAFNTLYFGAGPNGETNGVFGSLTPVATSLTQGNDL